MKLTELLEAAYLASGERVTARTHRYLTAQGVVSKPRGKTSSADYDEGHVAELVRYNKLEKSGYPLAAIKVLANLQEVTSGVFLFVNSSQLAPDIKPAAVAERVKDILTNIVKETNDADHDKAAE